MNQVLDFRQPPAKALPTPPASGPPSAAALSNVKTERVEHYEARLTEAINTSAAHIRHIWLEALSLCNEYECQLLLSLFGDKIPADWTLVAPDQRPLCRKIHKLWRAWPWELTELLPAKLSRRWLEALLVFAKTQCPKDEAIKRIQEAHAIRLRRKNRSEFCGISLAKYWVQWDIEHGRAEWVKSQCTAVEGSITERKSPENNEASEYPQDYESDGQTSHSSRSTSLAPLAPGVTLRKCRSDTKSEISSKRELAQVIPELARPGKRQREGQEQLEYVQSKRRLTTIEEQNETTLSKDEQIQTESPNKIKEDTSHHENEKLANEDSIEEGRGIVLELDDAMSSFSSNACDYGNANIDSCHEEPEVTAMPFSVDEKIERWNPQRSASVSDLSRSAEGSLVVFDNDATRFDIQVDGATDVKNADYIEVGPSLKRKKTAVGRATTIPVFHGEVQVIPSAVVEDDSFSIPDGFKIIRPPSIAKGRSDKAAAGHTEDDNDCFVIRLDPKLGHMSAAHPIGTTPPAVDTKVFQIESATDHVHPADRSTNRAPEMSSTQTTLTRWSKSHWLSDDDIDCALKLIPSRSDKILSAAYCDVQDDRPFGKLRLSADIKRIFLPLPLTRPVRHWCLGVVDLETRFADFYNPWPHEKYTKDGKAILQKFCEFLGKSEIRQPQLNFREISGVPKQSNSYDCGVFVIVIAYHLVIRGSLPATIHGDTWRPLLAGMLYLTENQQHLSNTTNAELSVNLLRSILSTGFTLPSTLSPQPVEIAESTTPKQLIQQLQNLLAESTAWQATFETARSILGHTCMVMVTHTESTENYDPKLKTLDTFLSHLQASVIPTNISPSAFQELLEYRTRLVRAKVYAQEYILSYVNRIWIAGAGVAREFVRKAEEEARVLKKKVKEVVEKEEAVLQQEVAARLARVRELEELRSGLDG